MNNFESKKEEYINNIQKELLITQEIYDLLEDNDPNKPTCCHYLNELKLILEQNNGK